MRKYSVCVISLSLIWATSSLGAGESARSKAVQLAQQLRQKHGAPVYIHSISQKKQEEEALRQASFRQRFPGVPVPKIRIPDEYVVLIGDYKDMESARKALAKLKGQAPSSSWMSWPTIPGRDKSKNAARNEGGVNDDSLKDFALTPKDGPWLICVKSFREDDIDSDRPQPRNTLARGFVVPNPLKNREGDVIQAGGRSDGRSDKSRKSSGLNQ